MAAERPFIRVNEVFRDGIQAVDAYLPVEKKLEYIDRVTQAIKPGYQATIEVTAFVNPKVIPQHADAESVLQNLTPRENVVYSVLIPNEHRLIKALEAQGGRKVGELAGFTSPREKFLAGNMNTTPEKSLAEIKKMHAAAEAAHIPFVVYVSCMARCPYDEYGEIVPPEDLRVWVDQIRQIGVQMIKLGATTGEEYPDEIGRALDVVLANDLQYPGVELGGHTHNKKGRGVINSMEFIKRGITSLDGSAAGVGVTRYGKGIEEKPDPTLPNNAPSDELVVAVEGKGYETAWDAPALARAGLWLARELGLPVHSEYADCIAAADFSREQAK